MVFQQIGIENEFKRKHTRIAFECFELLVKTRLQIRVMMLVRMLNVVMVVVCSIVPVINYNHLFWMNVHESLELTVRI